MSKIHKDHEKLVTELHGDIRHAFLVVKQPDSLTGHLLAAIKKFGQQAHAGLEVTKLRQEVIQISRAFRDTKLTDEQRDTLLDALASAVNVEAKKSDEIFDKNYAVKRDCSTSDVLTLKFVGNQDHTHRVITGDTDVHLSVFEENKFSVYLNQGGFITHDYSFDMSAVVVDLSPIGQRSETTLSDRRVLSDVSSTVRRSDQLCYRLANLKNDHWRTATKVIPMMDGVIMVRRIIVYSGDPLYFTDENMGVVTYVDVIYNPRSATQMPPSVYHVMA